VLHGAVQTLGEQKADARLPDALFDDFRRCGDVDAHRFEDVGAATTAGNGAVAVLGNGQAGPGYDQGGGSGDVEGVAAVTAGSAGVDHRRCAWVDAGRLLPHDPRRSGQLLDRLALDPQGRDESGDLCRSCGPFHDFLHAVHHLPLAEVLSGGDLRNRFPYHAATSCFEMESRKFRMILFPFGVRIDSG